MYSFAGVRRMYEKEQKKNAKKYPYCKQLFKSDKTYTCALKSEIFKYLKKSNEIDFQNFINDWETKGFNICIHDDVECPRPLSDVTKKKKNIPKALRMKVWEVNIGDFFIGKCYVCEREIRPDSFEAGHIIAEKNGGEVHIDNLKPICKPCNGSCGTMNLEEFKKSMTLKNNLINK
jgi:hypothetical protein